MKKIMNGPFYMSLGVLGMSMFFLLALDPSYFLDQTISDQIFKNPENLLKLRVISVVIGFIFPLGLIYKHVK